MEKLRQLLDEMIASLDDPNEFQERLDTLVSVYPFNEYEYIISTLLGLNKLTLNDYIELREDYIARNSYLFTFEMSPSRFGVTWAQGHLKKLVPDLVKPTKKLDPQYSSGEYDFLLDGRIKIEVKASRAGDSHSDAPLSVKALLSDSGKQFDMNFQQIKPACCDVFVWIAVWRDRIRYWVLSSTEVETNRYFSVGQHRGNVGEGQLHLNRDNIRDFSQYEYRSDGLLNAIRGAYERQQGR